MYRKWNQYNRIRPKVTNKNYVKNKKKTKPKLTVI